MYTQLIILIFETQYKLKIILLFKTGQVTIQ